MAANRPRICVAIVNADLVAIEKAEPLADLFEIRIDLIGDGWREVAVGLKKPWLACNRRVEENGRWQGDEMGRIEALVSAAGLGADIIDIELATPDVMNIVKDIKGKAKCLISHHDLTGTPALENMRGIVNRQLATGADICKVVTTAHTVADNIEVLELIREFPGIGIIAYAMGAAGQLSRVLAPLVGSYLTYASIEGGRESAAGQLTASELNTVYRMLDG